MEQTTAKSRTIKQPPTVREKGSNSLIRALEPRPIASNADCFALRRIRLKPLQIPERFSTGFSQRQGMFGCLCSTATQTLVKSISLGSNVNLLHHPTKRTASRTCSLMNISLLAHLRSAADTSTFRLAAQQQTRISMGASTALPKHTRDYHILSVAITDRHTSGFQPINPYILS